MAIVKFGYYGIDMSDYTFDLSDLPAASIDQNTSTTLSGYVGGVYVVIKGSGFSYDNSGMTGGTVKSISETYGGSVIASISGISVSVRSLVSAIESGNAHSLLTIVKSALSGNDTITGSQYADYLIGYNGNDKLYGLGGDDRLWGSAGGDYMSGGAGNDVLRGKEGNDTLFGGRGQDDLYGGDGKDSFVFKSLTDSPYAVTRDIIFDFTSEDRIDLSAIDAVAGRSGNQAFSYVGTKAFSGSAGELRYDKKASDTYIYADLNGDKKADISIHLDDAASLQKGYFIL